MDIRSRKTSTAGNILEILEKLKKRKKKDAAIRAAIDREKKTRLDDGQNVIGVVETAIGGKLVKQTSSAKGEGRVSPIRRQVLSAKR